MMSRYTLSLVVAAGLLTAATAWSVPPRTPTPTPAAGSSQNTALISQRKAVQDASAECTRIKGNMARIRSKTEATFSTKDDWVAAKKAVDEAKAQTDAAQKVVLDKVHKR